MREFSIGGAPHTRPATSVSRIMRQVIYALIPALVTYCWFFGLGILFQVCLACGFALTWEALALRVQNKALKPFLTDGSACRSLFQG